MSLLPLIVLGLGVVFPILYAPESLLFAQQFPADVSSPDSAAESRRTPQAK